MNPQDSNFFTLFGHLAVRLSNLESIVDHLLEDLIDQDSPVIGGLIISDVGFFKKLDLIKTLTEFQFALDDAGRDRILEVIKKIDELRTIRNEVIHGLWTINALDFAKGTVICEQTRWRKMKSQKQWTRYRRRLFSFVELNNYAEKAIYLCADVTNLINFVRSSKTTSKRVRKGSSQDK